MIRAKHTPKRQPQVKFVSATPNGRSYTYTYKVGSQVISVTFGGMDTESYFTTGERTEAVCAAIRQAQRDHSLLSL